MLIETYGAQADTRSYAAWRRHGLLLLLLLGLLVIAYAGTWQHLARTWWVSVTYNHGLLIIPISSFLIWHLRDKLQWLPPRIGPLGLVALLGLVGAWVLGRVVEVMLLQQLALILMIPTLSYCLLGFRVVTCMAFPLAYLLFAVPAGDGLVAPLQDFTAWFTVAALRLSGLPVLLEGRLISIPSGDFLVAEACSGVRYVIASVALGCLYAYLNYNSSFKRLIFIGFSLVLPIIANGIRAYGIVLLAHASNHQLAVGVDHLLYGWLFFGMVIGLMFWVGGFWQEDPRTPDQPAIAREMTASPPIAVFIMASLVAATLALGPWTAGRMDAHHGARSMSLNLAPPSAPPGWEGPLEGDLHWQPYYPHATLQYHVQYRSQTGNAAVALFAALYAEQRQGEELIYSENRLFDPERWFYQGAERRQLPLPDGTTLDYLETRLQNTEGQERLLWHWYRIGSHHAITPTHVKLLEAWELLSGGTQGSRLYVLSSDYQFAPDEARDRLQGWLLDLAYGGGVVEELQLP